MIWLSCKLDKPNRTRPSKPSTDPPDPTTLMDGQWVEALQTRLCRVGQKITPKPEPPDPCPPLIDRYRLVADTMRGNFDMIIFNGA